MITPLVTPGPAIEHQIRSRAFELYLRRGREDGHGIDDWLQAERDIFRELHEIAAKWRLLMSRPSTGRCHTRRPKALPGTRTRSDDRDRGCGRVGEQDFEKEIDRRWAA